MNLNIEKTTRPHLGTKILHAGSDVESAKNVMIMIHGRGAGAESILALADHLTAENMAFIAPQAQDLTWYPFRFIEKRQANEPGISSGLQLIDAIINSLMAHGIGHDRIFLLGFSQGACLAVDYAARHPRKYAGIFGLSGGLIGAHIDAADYDGDLEKTPVFLGCSENDSHIPEQRVHESAAIFTTMNASVTKKLYAGLGHTINRDELDIINRLLNNGSYA